MGEGRESRGLKAEGRGPKAEGFAAEALSPTSMNLGSFSASPCLCGKNDRVDIIAAAAFPPFRDWIGPTELLRIFRDSA